MHPAYSVILFTTASGAGYGLMFWLGLGHALDLAPGGRWAPLIALTLALVLVTVGLLSSTFHLGHPERAWRALSQWRSSWLSREGIVSVATYLPAGLLWLSFALGETSGATRALGALAALGAAATVWCTGMIYASLPTIRHWHRREVAPLYLALAAATGALLIGAFGLMAGAWIAALGSLAAAAALKLAYWRGVDADPGRHTAARALGLPEGTPVRPLDPPHTQPNFVMREMGYAVARRHARRLRTAAALLLFAAPAMLVALGLLAEAPPLGFALACLSAAVGVVVERWLFFAEAEHVSMLYYGRDRA